ncbi:DUF4237 domain-containing protein [Sphaerisporangium album]|uniref:DUF4237 domain-containing protein n=1 Tax=Sphaerisporangium album TaxID=509200 RepID=A0A367FG80_9ACTN|nr:TNT domain-containing protein [Sphaerisporangium album]RCG29403.1 DUF4237 domain-containing protein [Sphaerisporangium album]
MALIGISECDCRWRVSRALASDLCCFLAVLAKLLIEIRVRTRSIVSVFWRGPNSGRPDRAAGETGENPPGPARRISSITLFPLIRRDRWVGGGVPEFAPIDQEDPLRNFRRRASLAAAIGITALSLAGVPAQAGTQADSVTRTAFGRTAAPATPAVAAPPPVGLAALSARAGAAGVAVRAAAGDSTPGEPVCAAPYVNEDPRLGPQNLPRKGILGRILSDYDPLGGLRPQKFLNRYWEWSLNSYRFPPDFGFAHSGGYSNGRPLIAQKTLRIGERVDRFGSEFGAFLAPYGTPYPERSIPPTNLDTFPDSPQYPCNYHAYRVSRDFAVDFGPIASAFQQPGGGSQYHLVSRLIAEAPQMREEVPVRWLVDNGYLQPIN